MAEDLKMKALETHERLCKLYGCPVKYFHNLDPLSELISSLLSHRTRNSDSGRAFRNLRQKYPNWEELRDAPMIEVMHEIRDVTWPEQKAPRIQTVLKEITIKCGSLNLGLLEAMTEQQAQDWLEELPGVGPKTSAAVLIFSHLRKRALPVDSHHHRVAQRLGLIPSTLQVGPSHKILKAQLPEDWDAQKLYDNHEVLMFHGQRCCYYQAPACERCPLIDMCPTGMSLMKLPVAPTGLEHPNPNR